jgi:RNA polymerase sigma-70 factor, ECF subfamily
VNTANIEAAIAGDRQAQAQLLNLLGDRWFRLCLSLLGDADAARDAVQETALRFLRQISGFAGQSRLETWALGIAINVVREMKRKRRPLPKAACEALSSGAAPPADAESEALDERQRLLEVLDELPDRQREAVLLRFFEGLSVDETARAMDCAAGTVKATIHQALRAMKKRLESADVRPSHTT